MQGVGKLWFLLVPLCFLIEKGSSAAQKEQVYIVYMGAANDYLDHHYFQLLTSVSKRKKTNLVHSYRHGFSGFSARLSETEAQSLADKPGVASVFPDPVFQLHTTHSWDFLKYQLDVELDQLPSSGGSDTVIGLIDSGIWPESESFSDKDMGPVPSHWKGTCVEGYNFNSSHCNRKLIGARYYNSPEDDEDKTYQTARDMVGHGSHTASTAAGAMVPRASYYGLAEGTARGGSPGSRIAAYRVCSANGCYGSSILKAFDDAIADGVHVLSISLGAPSSFMPELDKDPISIGAFHAVENGITVVCSAGNDGPYPRTVVNSAPWILTVGATTIDRDLESDIVLGGNKVIKGEGINFANIGKYPVNPLVYAKTAKKADADEDDASNCRPNSMDESKIKGKIVFCDNEEGESQENQKKDEVQRLGGIGLILVNDQTKAVAGSYKEFPMTLISSKDGAQVLLYINSTENPVATILPTTTVTNYKPAPMVAYFSARGPSSITTNILKPDIAAPGVNILAAWKANDTEETVIGKEPPLYNMISGTSMSCPHVAGIAAEVKSHNPTWSPSAIKSAIMTTASQTNNVKAAITTDSGLEATPYDYGAGEAGTTRPLQPGLVYETTTIDYLNFLCYSGYDTVTVKIISKNMPEGFTCPKDLTTDLISSINYPSIAISGLAVNQMKNVSRTLTNVDGDGNATYTSIIVVPSGVAVGVGPTSLQFTTNGERQTFHASFKADKPIDDDVFGAITWTNGKFKVRIPFVVSSKSSKKLKN
ncbi:CO(2)-response secreted protease-like [Mercurialis annua]|uniref:CO(2)-response secreted protease-like n=1 Tax=Mercurialis annua TaxID=3986 RepID=UPI00215EA661|nr:CO(2)-response secreted protease-like [Mercurialis annua]